MGSIAAEWTVTLSKDEHGDVFIGLYEVGMDGQLGFIGAEAFGPFDTATDVMQWLIRHWSPRARLPLR